MRRREPVCIVGSPALRDFHAALCAANLEAAGDRGARDRGRPRARSRRRQRARARAALRRPRLPRRVRGASSRRCLRGDERVGLPAVLGLRDPHGAWADLQRRLGRGVFEIPTLPPSVPGMRAFEALRTALRAAGGRLILGSEVIGAERDGGRVTAVATHAAGHDVALPRALVRARHGRLRLGRDRARLGLGHARDGARPAAARRPRPRRAALRGRLPRRAADGARGGGGRRRRCAPRAPRTCSSPAPRCRAPCRGARDRARASRWPAATARRRSRWPRARTWGRRHERRRRARGAPARVARPLREVHDLRDRLPGLQRHAALRRDRSTPGRRPSATAWPTSPRSRRRSTTARAAASARRSARRA